MRTSLTAESMRTSSAGSKPKTGNRNATGINCILNTPVKRENVLTIEKIFELSSKAHFLYLTRNTVDRAQLLKSALLNCATDGVNLTPAYRKPFDLIFHELKLRIGRGERI
jgi:hypothetical protein